MNDLKKVIESFYDSDIKYYLLDSFLSRNKRINFVNFLFNKNKNNEIEIYKNIIFDKVGLTSKVNLDCFNCSKLNTHVCCYGSPCALTAEESENLLNNIFDIVKDRFDKDTLNTMLAYGMVYEDEDGNLVPLQYEHGCSFLMTTKEGYRLCAIKNWCIANKIDIVGMCPSSCIMFPLDILEIICDGKKYYYITSILDDTYAVKFSRWGVGTGSGYQCLGKGKIPKEYKGKMFLKDKFVEVYKEFEYLIKSWFDAETYDFIDKKCKLYD